ncbi:MAG: MerR family transcriptional regulator [Bradyrhizobium sp.]|uniref:MerR family transcriptional regulator n=1 Tax=Bradyrhizobium sp. TaxID=376 RepID=UPI001C294822|nr:MerR family transcriptional regulator [Bradyrhizobium sp.]MBU6462454.1 MerR family transcriptional regulator [Pseudomonadota bacterium]MDE2067788.1 MerR family transcriptional regulator [Bradyrhizobium sp.]MDE2242656.1 MerR family transcriptional regulator [Bradyrhizobium sp.]MDE2470281.1 MerR family transcriptional regulator [Bradyrhizobium sp.]
MDKAPDAFRTISEVADDLDIPQHVLRFWETRFTQIKPMKRSGGRRYYRPDDVDLLRGIRRLLYGEGYTIRGVQRILKEYGIKAVQGLSEGSTFSSAAFAGIEAGIGDALREPSDYEDGLLDLETDDEDQEDEEEITDQDDEVPAMARRAPEFVRAPRLADPSALPRAPAAFGVDNGVAAYKLDTARLKAVLDDLIACRQLLDQAMEKG